MLFRKLIRTVGVYKAQFISMIIMIALGTGVFVGFNMEWVSIEESMFRSLKTPTMQTIAFTVRAVLPRSSLKRRRVSRE